MLTMRPSIDGPTYDKKKKKIEVEKYQNKLKYVNATATIMLPTISFPSWNTSSERTCLKKKKKDQRPNLYAQQWLEWAALSVLRGCHLLFHHLAHFLLEILARLRSGFFNHAGNLVCQFNLLLAGLVNKLLDGVC